LREGSFIVLGPYARLEDALQAALHEVFDVALLDVNLDGSPVWPVAAAIKGRNIPFLLTTGYSEGLRYPSEFKDVHVVRKPFQRQDLFAGISKVMQRASHVQPGA
jgi:CheY-like chemotaxis protein